MDSQAQLLGRDFLFTDDWAVGAAADYLVVDDQEALWQWIRICLATSPGEYKHDPGFGVGVGTFVKKPATGSNKALLRRRIIDQLSRDRRIEGVDVVDLLSFTSPSGQPGLRIDLQVKAAGEVQRNRSYDFTARAA